MSERLIEAAKRNIEGEPFASPRVPHVVLVREAVASLGWATMTYACDACGFEWEVWLGLGVEGPPGLREASLYVASPMFAGRCPAWVEKPDATEVERARFQHLATCDGHMAHVRFGEDREFAPALIPDDAPRFVLDSWHDPAMLVMPEPAIIRARSHHHTKGQP